MIVTTETLLVGTLREVTNETLGNAVEPSICFCGTVLGSRSMVAHRVSPYNRYGPRLQVLLARTNMPVSPMTETRSPT